MGVDDKPERGQINSTRVHLETRGGKFLDDKGSGKGKGEFALAVAKIISVNYAELEVTLQVKFGEGEDYQRVPVPLTFPGAGPRHFFGALPERGSYAVIGYMATEPHKTPLILSWFVPGAPLGRDWLPTQEFEPREFDFNKRRQTELEGVYERSRRKLRHMAPGNIIASSAQGADIQLDESVLITTRRATEIYLRDQDQSIITRSLQKFDVQGGVRVSSGMVQRDATLLPSQMISDGIAWAAFRQRIGTIPLTPDELTRDQRGTEGNLTPNNVFLREGGKSAPISGMDFRGDFDPYEFLSRGLIIDRSGSVNLDLAEGGVYGGKQVFRTSYDPTANPDLGRVNSFDALDEEDSLTLTEHRIEVTHTWDQTLPVSEQTDGFDADRLPGSQTDESNELQQGDVPFVTSVYGSVVGNDPYTETGRKVYGIPLAPVVFDADTGNPVPSLVSGLGMDIDDHAATYLEVKSPLTTGVTPTWFSITKGGKVKGSIGGTTAGDSLELTAVGGMRVLAGGPIRFESEGGVCFFNRGGTGEGNLAYDIDSKTGGVRIAGGGPITTGSQSALLNPQDGNVSDLPHLKIEATKEGGNVHIEAYRNIVISSSNSIQINRANDVTITPKTLARILTDKVSIQAKTLDRTIMGQNIDLFSGPKDFNPTNLPLRSVTFSGNPVTGHIGGVTDQYKVLWGDREETFIKGNHITQILVGDMTYVTGVGTIKHQAGLNTVKVSTASGFEVSVPVGTISMSTLFSASLKGAASVSVSSVGPATLSGIICKLGGAGKFGGIVSQSDLDPLTGLPLATYGMGSPGHILTPPI